MRTLTFTCSMALICLSLGCAHAEYNASPAKSENDSLSDVIQLTHGFDRAGEAYFSADMRWIIFQAVPKGETQYQMYVAPLNYNVKDESPAPGTVYRATPLPNLKVPRATGLLGIGDPIRISPTNSRNTCGWFSPDGRSILFASTAGKEKPDEPSSGYQRQGGNYRWSYPTGMELFRADGWEQAVMSSEPGKLVDLAKNPLTNNEAYDAEGSYSPDGKWLVFTSNRTGDLELYAMRPDGSDLVQLTNTPGYDGGPFFSPDGKRLLYRSDRKKNDLLQVYVSDLVYRDGKLVGLTNEKKLTHDDETPAEKAATQPSAASQPTTSKQNVNWGPYWHPDGKHIVYATSLHGHTNYEIYLMRDDGSAKTRITFHSGADVLPVFSPDGKYLMWASKRTSDNTTQVFLAKFTFPKGS